MTTKGMKGVGYLGRSQRLTGNVQWNNVPTVIDRVIQQAILLRLQPLWDPTFSEHSYGFRPGRSAHQAVAQAQAYIIEGYRFVVDIDLAKFFDRVNHDRLMAAVAARVTDRRLLRLIRSYLAAGVLDNGLFEDSREGTPQGGPLSPLLSNLVLDELDRELERRGHRFVRYADDCNIYVRSEKAGRRVMESLTRFVERRLKLQINAEKSAVARPWHRSFLSFTVRNEPEFRRCIANKTVVRFKHRVRELTGRHRGITLERMIRELVSYLRGWAGYFGFSQWHELQALDGWIRRRLRCVQFADELNKPLKGPSKCSHQGHLSVTCDGSMLHGSTAGGGSASTPSSLDSVASTTSQAWPMSSP